MYEFEYICMTTCVSTNVFHVLIRFSIVDITAAYMCQIVELGMSTL